MSEGQNVINVLLFTDFESLDVFGPIEILGRSGYELRYFFDDWR